MKKGIIIIVTFYFSGLFTASFAQDGVVYSEDFETGIRDPNLNLTCTDAYKRFSIQSDMTRYGSYAARLENSPNAGVRCELTYNGPADFHWGVERWLGYSFSVPYLSKGFGIISQHHSVPGYGTDGKVDWSYPSGANGFTIMIPGGDGNEFWIQLIPPENLNDYESGTLSNPLKGGATNSTNTFYSWPVELNRWFDIVLNFRYSDKSDGFYKVWVNGELVIDITGSNVNIHDTAGRIKETRNYLKTGIYSGTEGGGAVIYDEIRVGDETSNYEAVAPRTKALITPSSLTAFDSTANSISLNWTPSIENIGVAEYDVYRGGTFAGTSKTTEYTDTLLSPTTTYSYTVKGRDLVGNETAMSAAMEATTLQEQIISITSIADKFTNDAAFDVKATVNTGLDLTYEVSGPATISGNTITLDGSIGTVEVTVHQVGDAIYGKTSIFSSFEVMLITDLPTGQAGLGIEEALPIIKIYPIPTTDWLNIGGTYSDNASVQVIDIMGKQVLFEKLRNYRVSVGKLPEGTYVLNISDQGIFYKAKIIVQR